MLLLMICFQDRRELVDVLSLYWIGIMNLDFQRNIPQQNAKACFGRRSVITDKTLRKRHPPPPKYYVSYTVQRQRNNRFYKERYLTLDLRIYACSKTISHSTILRNLSLVKVCVRDDRLNIANVWL